MVTLKLLHSIDKFLETEINEATEFMKLLEGDETQGISLIDQAKFLGFHVSHFSTETLGLSHIALNDVNNFSLYDYERKENSWDSYRQKCIQKLS